MEGQSSSSRGAEGRLAMHPGSPPARTAKGELQLLSALPAPCPPPQQGVMRDFLDLLVLVWRRRSRGFTRRCSSSVLIEKVYVYARCYVYPVGGGESEARREEKPHIVRLGKPRLAMRSRSWRGQRAPRPSRLALSAPRQPRGAEHTIMRLLVRSGGPDAAWGSASVRDSRPCMHRDCWTCRGSVWAES